MRAESITDAARNPKCIRGVRLESIRVPNPMANPREVAVMGRISWRIQAWIA